MYRTLRDDFTQTRHDLLLTRVLALPDERKLRTRIRRNSYDAQSHAVVELWTPMGWTQVVTLDGEHDTMKALPSYVTRDLDGAYAALAAVANELEQTAMEVTA